MHDGQERLWDVRTLRGRLRTGLAPEDTIVLGQILHFTSHHRLP